VARVPTRARSPAGSTADATYHPAGLKILVAVHAFPPETFGGTERTVEALARAFAAAGHEVAVVAGSLRVGAPSRWDEEHQAGLRVLRVHRDDLYFESWFKGYAPAVSATFERLVAQERPDVVHVHHWLRLSTDLVRVARALGATTAVTLHDYWSVLARPARMVGENVAVAPPGPRYLCEAERAEAFQFHRRDLRDELRSADVRFSPSEAHARGLGELADGDLGAIEVSAPPLLAPPARRERGGARGRRLAVWGALYDAKGLEVLLAALRQAQGGWSLEVLGEAHDPGYAARIAELAHGLPVRMRGAFAPRDLAALDADYAVLPALSHESYGLVLDEAFCLGLPVLASDLPAWRERGDPRWCAFFPPGDAAALAGLLRDERRLRQLAPPPPPRIATAAQAAEHLLARYAQARAARGAGCERPEPVTDRERALVLFRRAERRLWTALQHEALQPPPDEFLA
jgi:glycosyltransferase involved in cell wall biosynthesis